MNSKSLFLLPVLTLALGVSHAQTNQYDPLTADGCTIETKEAAEAFFKGEFKLKSDATAEWRASGRIPTAHGYICLEVGEEGVTNISIPEGCKVTVLRSPSGIKTLTKPGEYSL